MAIACGKGDGLDVPPAPVTIQIAAPVRIVQEVYAPSRLSGVEEALVYAGAGGRVEEVLVSEGDSVSVGQRLVRLATDRQVSAGTSAAQAGIAAASANESNAARTLERIESLYEAGAVSEQELDGTRAMYEAARAALQQAWASGQQAGSVADNSYVQAPFDGRVGRIWVRAGNMAGGGPVVSISNSSALVARILLPEQTLPLIAEGLPAYISVTAYDGESFPGMVTAAARSVDPVSGLVPVEVSFDNAGSRLMPGMTGRVAVAVDSRDSVIALPEIAFRRDVDGYQVVLEVEGAASVVPVTRGITNRGMVEVTSGLEPGDHIIVEGQFRVADGDPVEVVETR